MRGAGEPVLRSLMWAGMNTLPSGCTSGGTGKVRGALYLSRPDTESDSFIAIIAAEITRRPPVELMHQSRNPPLNSPDDLALAKSSGASNASQVLPAQVLACPGKPRSRTPAHW